MRSDSLKPTTPAMATKAANQPQCRTKALMASIIVVSRGSARLLLTNTLATCGTT